MAIYRDDALDNIFLSDSTWLRLKSMAEDYLVLSDLTETRIRVDFGDSFHLADEVNQNGVIHTAYDAFQLSDSVISQKIARTNLLEQFKLTDSAYAFLSEYTDDQISLGDATLAKIKANSKDSIQLNETITAKRYAKQSSYDQFKLTDQANTVASAQVTDSILLEDFYQDKLYAKSYAFDDLVFSDEVLSNVQLNNHAIDSIRFGAVEQCKLIARSDSNDYFSLYDTIKDSKSYGQAWTANTDTWAMSRYMPYTFDGLSVINGQLYGWNAQGVYTLGQPSNAIQGLIQTGKLDFGDNLVHPTAAFLEYEMTGDDKQLSIAVTTTQSGQSSTYRYLLANEVADHLTNGRVVFGRGLRGRHFAFEISIAAQSAKINALSMEFTKTNRRI